MCDYYIVRFACGHRKPEEGKYLTEPCPYALRWARYSFPAFKCREYTGVKLRNTYVCEVCMTEGL
jgi:hypothetical protein